MNKIYVLNLLFIALIIALLSACGGGSGGDGPAPVTEKSKNWDEMTWDSGQWG